jgi:uncharacterized protein YbbK (DUF523 family)
MGFVMDELAQWVAFKPVCPEMAIGLPVPARRCGWCRRPRRDPHALHAPHDDVTEKMADFASAHLSTLGELSGFIVCAKSPSCGMERVRLYDEKAIAGEKKAQGCLPAR